jgi:hypothetical protein
MVIVEEKNSKGLKYVSIKSIEVYFWNCIMWLKKLRRGK